MVRKSCIELVPCWFGGRGNGTKKRRNAFQDLPGKSINELQEALTKACLLAGDYKGGNPFDHSGEGGLPECSWNSM